MVDETDSAKGRATPSRKEAQAARKQQMKVPVTNKEAARRRRAEAAARQRDALNTGDQRYLPRRDQGPVRAFCRDFIDRQYTIAEFLLPILVIILAVSFTGASAAIGFVWAFSIIGTLLNTIVVIVRLRQELRRRFPGQSTRGAMSYTVLRSTQLRRFRLPKPQIARRGPLREHY